ncbi:MAG: hypothetical protein AB1634_00355 [Thermodesulfobacteriota bacterium]
MASLPAPGSSPLGRWAPGLLLAVAVVAVYGNSLDAGWHLDDRANILDNPNLRLTDWRWASLARAMAGPPASGLLRPFSFLTLAVSWSWGGTAVAGYHLVNLGLHLVAACGLFLFLAQALDEPRVGGRLAGQGRAIALAAALWWAIHPVHVPAVTYIVQRMAVQAGAFQILALAAFLAGRRARQGRGWPWYALTGLFGLVSMGSKENGLLLPVNILLTEWLLGPRPAGRIWPALLAGLGLATMGAALAWHGPERLLAAFDLRPFTLEQRLITEPRVLGRYLSLLAWPAPSRLMLLHDLPVSTGLFTPWTTAAALLALTAVLVLSLAGHRRAPLPAFAGLFFLANHAIEGSVLPLELAFEHRNYLPAMPLFALPAMGIAWLGSRLGQRAGPAVLAALAAAGLVAWEAAVTRGRNQVFASEISLWEDNVAKAPGLRRPRQNLGLAYLEAGRPQEARVMIESALAAREDVARRQEHRILLALAATQDRLGDWPAARISLEKALAAQPGFLPAALALARRLWQEGELAAAEARARQARDLDPSPESTRLLAQILVTQGRALEAVRELEAAVARWPQEPALGYLLGEVQGLAGLLPAARTSLQAVLAADPDALPARLALIDLALLAGDQPQAQALLADLAARLPRTEILAASREIETANAPLAAGRSDRLAAALAGSSPQP